MSITPLRSCHDTAVPQLQLLPSPCVCFWADNGVSVRSTVAPLQPQSPERQHRGQTQPRATSTPLAAFPLRGWLGHWRQGAIDLTGYTRSPAHTTHLAVLPAVVTFLHQLNTPPVVPGCVPVPEHMSHLNNTGQL